MTCHPHSTPASTESTPRSQLPCNEPHPFEYLMDPRTTATFLGVSVLTLADWRAKGIGPDSLHVGRCVRYRRSSIEAWLARHSRRGDLGAMAD